MGNKYPQGTAQTTPCRDPQTTSKWPTAGRGDQSCINATLCPA